MPEPSSTITPLAGGCQCGAVRYTVHAAPQSLYHCHCQMCRKVHGAMFATFAVVPVADLVIAKGADQLSRFESSPGVLRLFCRGCGCQLFSTIAAQPEKIYFTPTTLDDGAHPGHPPAIERHVYVGSKVPWYAIDSRLPQFDTN
jgi:hypothetical protein